MNDITSKDIKALREYLDRVEALESEEPAMLTPEEWDEAWKGIQATGRIPKKYAGRIKEREVEVLDGVERILDDNGEPLLDEEGNPRYKPIVYETPQKTKAYFDVVWEEWNRRRASLNEEYHDSIVKVFGEIREGDEDKTLLELIKAASESKVLDITNLPNLLPTDKKLQYAITPYRNEYAYIMPFDYGKLNFAYDEGGEIIIQTEAQYNAIEEAKDKKNKIAAAGIDQPLLRQLLAATMEAYLCNYGNSITVYLPSFAREMNIDISGANKKAEADDKGNPEIATKHNANDFFKKLKALEGLNGVWQNGSFYRVFVLEGYEAEQNTLTFSSPWLFKIVKELLLFPASKRTRADGSIMWEITGISSLIKSSIVSARSKPTIEILATLLVGLQQYGVKPEAKRHPGKKYKDKELVVYEISIKTLIERIPLVMENLNSYSGKPSNQTTLLQRYFCGSNFKKRLKDGKGYLLEEYIDKYTFIKDYYKDFKIEFQPPTMKTLSDKITIQHRGINGDFKTNNPLNKLRFQNPAQKEEEEDPAE